MKKKIELKIFGMSNIVETVDSKNTLRESETRAPL